MQSLGMAWTALPNPVIKTNVATIIADDIFRMKLMNPCIIDLRVTGNTNAYLSNHEGFIDVCIHTKCLQLNQSTF